MVRKFIRRKDASERTRKSRSALLIPLKGRKVRRGTPLYDYRGRLLGRKK